MQAKGNVKLKKEHQLKGTQLKKHQYLWKNEYMTPLNEIKQLYRKWDPG